MIGPIRPELLSGIKFVEQFKKLKKTISFFHDYPIRSSDYEKAAELFNHCRKNGIQGSNTDFLMCAIAINHNGYVYETFGISKQFPVKIQ
jgi:predicted nucleic acid-binding protein